MLGLGGASTMGLGLVMTLDDQFSKAAKNVAGSLGDLDAVVNSFTRIDQFGQGMSDFGMFIAKGLGASVKEFAKFEDIMNSVKVIAGDQGLSDADFEAMNRQVKKLGEMYGVLPDAVANAQLELAKAGKKPTEIMAMTEATMALGAATDTVVSGANGAAEILVNLMQAFNATANEADKYAAAITSAANQSTIDVKDFYQSIRYSADIANSLGIGIDEVAASIATLGNAGLKGSIAGTSYSNMLRYLAKAVGQFGTEQQKAALELLNIDKSDLINKTTGSLKSMAEILDLLREKYKGMDPITRLAATQGVFGVRGDRAAQPLIQGIMESNNGLVTAFEEMSRRINDDIANNVHLQQAEKRMNDLMGDYQKFTAALSNLKIAIGAGLAPMLRPLLQRLSSGMRALTEFFESDTGKYITKIIGASSVWMIVLGKMISYAARFYIWMLTSAGQLKAAFTVGTRSARIINTSLIDGSLAFARNVMLAANKWVLASTKAARITSLGNIQLIGANGRFGRGIGKANWFTALFGLFGRGGLRTYVKLAAWFGRVLPWAARFGGFIRLLGPLLGKVFGTLFGWPGLIADIGLTLITGKGLFEWLWEGVKALASTLSDFDQTLSAIRSSLMGWWDSLSNNAFGRVFKRMVLGDTNAEKVPYGNPAPLPAYVTPPPAIFQDRFKPDLSTITKKQKDQISNHVSKTTKSGTNTIVNVTVNTPDGQQTKRRINVDQERSIQSYAIN